MKTRWIAPALALLVTLSGLVIGGLSTPVAATFGEPDDQSCGCPETGAWQAPTMLAPYLSPTGGSAASAPVYTTATTGAGDGTQTVVVSRASDASQVAVITMATDAAWGFSPDQDKLTVAYPTAPGSGSFVNAFYDFTQTPVLRHSVTMAGGYEEVLWRWSPHGEYAVTLGRNNTGYVHAYVYDAATYGADVGDVVGTGRQSSDTADWLSLPMGFSPDDDEFLLTVRTSATTVMPYVAHLAGHPALSANNFYDNVDASTQFRYSPCGDVLATIGPGNPAQVRLWDATADYTSVGIGVPELASGDFAQPVSLSTTSTHHVVTAAGTSYNLLGSFPPRYDGCPPEWHSTAELIYDPLAGPGGSLEWDPLLALDNVAITGFRLRDGGGHVIAEPGASTDHVELTGLEPNLSYQFTLVARDSYGWETTPLTVSFTTPATAGGGAAPTWAAPAITFTEIARDHITLSWSPVDAAGPGFYQVLDGTTVIAELPFGTTTYTHTGLARDTTHDYRIHAVDLAGRASTAAGEPVGSATTPSFRPTNLAAVAGDGSVRLSWEPPTGSQIPTMYRIAAGDHPNALFYVTDLYDLAGRSYTVTGQTNGIPRWYGVFAYDSATGEFGLAASAQVAPGLASAPTGLAALPSLEAALGTASLAVSWGAPAFDGGFSVTGYILQSGPTMDGPWTDVWSGATSSTEVSGTPGVELWVRVAAVNATGTGPWSAPASAVPYALAGEPTGLVATAGPGSATLSWLSPIDSGGLPVSSYVVEQAPSPAGPWSQVGTPGTASLEVTGLAAGTEVRFRVAAVTALGQGAWSEPITLTPLDPPPAEEGSTPPSGGPSAQTPSPDLLAPSQVAGLKAKAKKHRKIRLSWAQVSGATSYVVQLRSTKAGPWRTAGVTALTRLAVKGRGSKVWIHVAAIGAAGQGPWSGAIKVRVKR